MACHGCRNSGNVCWGHAHGLNAVGFLRDDRLDEQLLPDVLEFQPGHLPVSPVGSQTSGRELRHRSVSQGGDVNSQIQCPGRSLDGYTFTEGSASHQVVHLREGANDHGLLGEDELQVVDGLGVGLDRWQKSLDELLLGSFPILLGVINEAVNGGLWVELVHVVQKPIEADPGHVVGILAPCQNG